MDVNSDSELYLDATASLLVGTANMQPLGLSNWSVGGSDWRYGALPQRGQRGIAGAYGLNNIGLLVKTWGTVTSASATSFLIDDGSGAPVEVVVPAGGSLPAQGRFVMITGISSCHVSGGELRRQVLVGNPTDIVELHYRKAPPSSHLISGSGG